MRTSDLIYTFLGCVGEECDVRTSDLHVSGCVVEGLMCERLMNIRTRSTDASSYPTYPHHPLYAKTCLEEFLPHTHGYTHICTTNLIPHTHGYTHGMDDTQMQKNVPGKIPWSWGTTPPRTARWPGSPPLLNPSSWPIVCAHVHVCEVRHVRVYSCISCVFG